MRGLSTNMAGSSRPLARLGLQTRQSIAYPFLSRKASSTSRSTSPTKPSLNMASASGGPQDPLAYCSSLVQRLDPEAWLTSYFWKGRERAWFLAWRAFNLELHLITTTVTQPALAAIRFQFWRDALKTIFATPSTGGAGLGHLGTGTGAGTAAVPQHPVAVLLGDMRRNRPVQKYYLSQMIDTRAKNLTLPPASRTLEDHILTHGPLSSALLLGPLPLLLPPTHAQTSHVSHTLSHLATLLTITSLLRTLPIMVASKRQLNIPSDVASKHSIVEEDVLRNGAGAKGLKDGLWEIGTRGMDELITARRELKASKGRVEPGTVMPLFLSVVPAERYLKRLEQYDFDVFNPELQKHDWKLAPSIWWAYQRGKL